MLLLLDYALPSIRYIPVPQVPHLPFIALRPFFIVTSSPLSISLLCLHFTQYPSILSKHRIGDIKQAGGCIQ